MRILTTSLEGVLIVVPHLFEDRRGFFMETFHQKKYAEAGINRVFVQDNLSRSIRGTLRGLHYQLHHPQAKLVQVIRGEIFDVMLDIRRGSPSFGQWTSVPLSDGDGRQLFVPEGFAHGFCVLSEIADVIYKCTDFYSPEDEGGILWSDPGLNITWPVADPLLSSKDSQYPCLCDVASDCLPVYEERR